MKAVLWLKNDMTSGSGDEKPWVIGETRTIKGKIELCTRGYHSSESWYDALQYARGAMACIVEISGKTIQRGDKQVSATCKLIDARDAAKVLMEFDIDCAERVLPNFEKYNPHDDRPRKAIKAARDFNKGLSTQALPGVWPVVWPAVITGIFTTPTEWSVAKSVALSVVWSEAWSVSRLAEIKWQKQHLDKMIKKLFKE